MQPARYDFTIRRGDTARLGFALKTKDLVTGQVRPLLGPGDVLTWTIEHTDGDLVRTTAPSGGLSVDPQTGLILWKLSPDESRTYPLGPTPYNVRVKNDDGDEDTHLIGTIIANG